MADSERMSSQVRRQGPTVADSQCQCDSFKYLLATLLLLFHNNLFTCDVNYMYHAARIKLANLNELGIGLVLIPEIRIVLSGYTQQVVLGQG